ncbi:MAG: NUDIX hydrolase [Gammaproteobacteria bacterium]|nr:NUDIX hydrolase [Gammaproteobacteria bacterium]
MASKRADCKGVSQRPVRPRDAASLILLRRAGRGHQVLVGRRPPEARFLPGRYVFPGGSVESDDSRTGSASELNPKLIELMAVGGNRMQARGLAMAAVRETFEETGLLLAEPGDVGAVRSTSWVAMGSDGLAPALHRLGYVGRAITPVPSPIRFHARFFVADAQYTSGVLGGDSELEDLHWCPINELARLPTIEVQSFMLAHAVATLMSNNIETEGKPLFTQRAGQRYIRYVKVRS